MKRSIIMAAFLIAGLLPLASQEDERYDRFPDGRSRTEAILKADYKKSLAEASELLELAEELKSEIEDNEWHVLSVTSIDRAEKIEKLAKNIKRRLRRR